jgi:hypothetical protein
MSAIAFTTWLNSGQDFAEGLALLEQQPNARPAVLSLLRRAGAGSFTSAKLVEEIQRLLDELLTDVAALQVTDVRAVNISAERVQISPERVHVDEEPEEVTALVQERIRGFKTASDLHSTLLLLPTDAARAEALATIKQLFARNAEIWDALEYRKKYGVLPATVPTVTPENDPAGQTKRRNTLRTYLSSKRGTEEKRRAWAAELAQVERSLAQ